jgi:hypothetical protein
MTAPPNRLVKFIQYEEPPLKSGDYRITVTHTTNQAKPYDTFTEVRRFAVTGERFALGGDTIVSVFPPHMASGEFADVLPHVVLGKRTLPWARESVAGKPEAPWLAVLTFAASELPPTPPERIAACKVKDLVPEGHSIGVYGSSINGIGTMQATHISYPMPDPDGKLDCRLDYGESPEDESVIIDLPVDVFNRAAPCREDLAWLAHIREVDTLDSEDHGVASLQFAVVVGNRVAPTDEDTYAFLVSLESFGDYLPDADGSCAAALKDKAFVRLVVFRMWRFFANDGDAKFKSLVENLNKANSLPQLTTLRLPCAVPGKAAIEQAMAHEADGLLEGEDAAALAANALTMGYVPLDHRLRHAGNLVSWYRGPLVPYAVEPSIVIPQPSVDAMARYDPNTGMFDMSYAAAWQLGQLLALQNTGFATGLYAWKKQLNRAQAVQQELKLISQALKTGAAENSDAHPFAKLLGARGAYVKQVQDDIPKPIVDWIAKLHLLNGVPFAYLVPDEGMLPPESLRFFYLDTNWVNALIDGAFSIGRASIDDLKRDAALHDRIHGPASTAARSLRRNPRANLSTGNSNGRITGFVLRSQMLKGWPRLQVNGYAEADHELDKLRVARLSADVLLVIFDGEIKKVAIHEAPEQLHFGVEGGLRNFSTSLRALVAATVGSPPVDLHPGEQIPGNHSLTTQAAVPTRNGDGRTLKVAAAAAAIEAALAVDSPFTSAEFALEMIQGVARVEFQLSGSN